MELKDLVVIFDSGSLKSATIVRNVLGDGYNVFFDSKNGKHYSMTGQRTGDDPRVFKSIDAAAQNILKVGFRNFLVKL